MDVAAAAELIERELRAAGDPERAVNEKRYLKSDLTHLGVQIPIIRRIATGAVRTQPVPVREEVLALADRLWTHQAPGAASGFGSAASGSGSAASGYGTGEGTAAVHELRMAAIEVLIQQVRLLEAADLTVAERLIRESHGWAYVDALAIKVVGTLLGRYPELAVVLDRWAADADFWIRRTALLALLPGIRTGDVDLGRLSRYGEAMIDETEFFIRKALGWVLRDLSKRDPDWVRDWVAARIDRVSGVTLREAARHLPDADAEALLADYRSSRSSRTSRSR